MSLLVRLFSRRNPTAALDPRQEVWNRIVEHQWRAHHVLPLISEIETAQQLHQHRYELHDAVKDLAERDAVTAVVTKYQALDPYVSPYPDDRFDRVNIAEACLTAIVATLADPALQDRPADQCSDIRYHVRKDWCDSRREEVPPWYRRPGTGTYYPNQSA